MARIPEKFLQDLKEKVDIVSVIDQHVKLKKAGSNSYVGLCPFHSEKSPSFTVRPSHGTYRCFGCGANGSALDFLIEHSGYPFLDAVEQLARSVNMEMPKNTPEEEAAARRHDKLHTALFKAQDLYAAQLAKEPRMREYLEKRGVTPEMVARFGIGVAPSKPDFLRSQMKDVPLDILKSAGLVADFEKEGGGKEDYEVMRGRITFPIRSASGKIIAFGGRTLQPNAKAKYKNTGETELFKKSNELYGFYEGAEQIRKRKTAVVVEGYMDVIIPSGNGVANIVAPMGTALSKNAIARLFRNAETIIFCFDSDLAGRNAAVRSMENCAPMLKAGQTVRFAFLPDGMDPDEFVVAHGAEAFYSFLEKADPLSKFLIATYSSKNDMTSVEGRAKFASEALAVVKLIEDEILRDVLVDEVKLAARIGLADLATPIAAESAANQPSTDQTRPEEASGELSDVNVVGGLLSPPDISENVSLDSGSSPDEVPDYLKNDPGPQEGDFTAGDGYEGTMVEDFMAVDVVQGHKAPPQIGGRHAPSSDSSESSNMSRAAREAEGGRRPRNGFGQARSLPSAPAPANQVPKPSGGISPTRPVQSSPAAGSKEAEPPPRRRAGFAATREVVTDAQGAGAPVGTPPRTPAEPVLVPVAAAIERVKPASQGGEQMPAIAIPETYKRRGFAFVAEQRAAAAGLRQVPGIGTRAPDSAGREGRDAVESDGIAMRLMAIFVAQPIYAAFVEPEWLLSTRSTDDEMRAVTQMIEIVRRYNVTVNADGLTPISVQEFAQQAAVGSSGNFLGAAREISASKTTADLESEFAAAVEQLVRDSDHSNAARYKP